MTGPLDMSSYAITNLKYPEAATDAATKSYVDRVIELPSLFRRRVANILGTFWGGSEKPDSVIDIPKIIAAEMPRDVVRVIASGYRDKWSVRLEDITFRHRLSSNYFYRIIAFGAVPFDLSISDALQSNLDPIKDKESIIADLISCPCIKQPSTLIFEGGGVLDDLPYLEFHVDPTTYRGDQACRYVIEQIPTI